MPPLGRDVRKLAILETFDSMTAWKGVVWLSKRFGVSRQYVSLLLKTERPERYAALKHPSRGRRNDL